MTVLRSVIMAFSLFSRIPMPRVDWKPESMRYMMAAFPLVGCAIGLLLWAWIALCDVLGANAIVRAMGITILPIAVTGGIHMDGFSDVVDAQASHAEPDRKRDILKDPHVGSFAVIGIACYVLAYFACASQLDFSQGLAPLHEALSPHAALIVALALVHVLSRTGSGIATTAFPKASDKGMLAMEHDSAQKTPVLVALVIIALACIAGLALCSPIAAAAIALCWAASLPALRAFAMSQFKGMSGDIAGFYLQSIELALIAIIAVVQLLA